ncbi:hypothetical protein QFC22_006423 [Naganishia vaughanmartiniae]|uniref:Uncharacterized protein n=1 Tax=Naganishia vaughanmartiniae TaxID=1424756 RepID=A0ACC2WKU1_9TREE|nr:hypothetical protein QFC22_006423 [Naganishia vaughanmartiniae]
MESVSQDLPGPPPGVGFQQQPKSSPTSYIREPPFPHSYAQNADYQGASVKVNEGVKVPAKRKGDELEKVSKHQKDPNFQRRKKGQQEFVDNVLKAVAPSKAVQGKRKSKKSILQRSKKVTEEETWDDEMLNDRMSEEEIPGGETSTDSDIDKKEQEIRILLRYLGM